MVMLQAMYAQPKRYQLWASTGSEGASILAEYNDSNTHQLPDSLSNIESPNLGFGMQGCPDDTTDQAVVKLWNGQDFLPQLVLKCGSWGRSWSSIRR